VTVPVDELETILDHTPFMICHVDRDLRYVRASKAYAAVVGRTPDEIVGKRLADIMGAEGFEAVRPHVEAALQGQRVEFEAEVKVAPRGMGYYHVILVPECDTQGQAIGYVASIIDITRTKLSQEKLAAQLQATQRLQEISIQLLGEEKSEALYSKIVDAAASIMQSGSAALQVFMPLRGQLRLLASRGFSEEAERCWRWVTTETRSTCGEALRTRRRVIVPDVADNTIIVGADREAHLQNGIYAAQTTPLVSRTGHLVGMISTHWRHPYHPPEQDLASLDVLARQAADLIERSQTEDHTRFLAREVSHRAKNLLAVVQGIVQQTVGEENSNTWTIGLSARLAALAASQELIVQSNWRGVEVGALVRSQLQHLGALLGTRIRLDGGPMRIAPAAAQTLGMSFFELATNAVKYGALSNATGTVSIQWSLTQESDPQFRLSWQERNGPTVETPRRYGFGNEVMVQMVEHALDARVQLDLNPLGLRWRVAAPAATVLATQTDGVHWRVTAPSVTVRAAQNGLASLQSGEEA
jgi:PAS domain S-box-containing protein